MADKELFSIGKIYPSDFLKPGEAPLCEPMELKLMMDYNGIAFLENTPNPEVMWGEKYWYRSSISDSMKKQLQNVVTSVLDVLKLETGQLWIDIAGNDGYLLSQVPPELVRINIDPANDTFRVEAEKYSDLVIQDYFSENVFKKSKYGHRKASVISCISMFYDIVDPDIFLQDVKEILEGNGMFVLQLSYTPLMLEQLEFTNLCYEHKFYYSFFNIKKLLEKNGFEVKDVQLNNTNAGSFRLFVMKEGSNENLFASQTHRDVCKFRIEGLLKHEESLMLDKVSTWHHFYTRICELKYNTVSFIREEIKKGKTVYGYGASTKGNTLLQYFGLTNEYITAIADRSPYKHGLLTIGTNIPIISEDEMREKQPDYLLILPFHFLSEFMEREKEYLLKGGKFIVPLPTFKIITKEDL